MSIPASNARKVLRVWPRIGWRHSVFDPALYKSLDAKWLFSQKEAAFNAAETSTCGSKIL
jgi:hypothetical protein